MLDASQWSVLACDVTALQTYFVFDPSVNLTQLQQVMCGVDIDLIQAQMDTVFFNIPSLLQQVCCHLDGTSGLVVVG